MPLPGDDLHQRPDIASLNDLARKSVSVGLLNPFSLDGLFDPAPLNDVLKTAGRPQVKA